MNKLSYILLLFVLLFSNSDALAQNTNPFEIKSRIGKVNKSAVEKNVFDIKEPVDTIEQIHDMGSVNNPFELNKTAKANKKLSSSSRIRDKKQFNKSFEGSSDFLLWIFLFVLIFLALLMSVNRGLIQKIVKVIWYYNHTNSLLRNFAQRDFLFYFFLFAIFVVNLSLFLYLLIMSTHDISGLNFFIRIFGLVAIIYILKHISIILFNWIFPSLKALIIYNFTILLFNISLGIFLLPVNLIAAYSVLAISSIFLIFGIVLIVIMYFLRLFRGFLVTYNYFSISIFHFFIYLCAFEILPLLILYKFFVNYL